jgi:hypothetical protein
MGGLLGRIAIAWRRFEACLERVLDRGPGARPIVRLAIVAGCAAVAWWIYVPLHELAHAGACVSCGGEVKRMTLAPIYGGSIAARFFPWIDDDTPYAGQLADFDPGSDLCYLWLVLAPFAATPLARPLLSRAARAGSAPLFAAGALLALMPIASVTGDFYEAASIVVTRAAEGAVPDARLLRSDDLLALVSRLRAAHAGATGWALVTAAVLLGAIAATALSVSSIPRVPPKTGDTGAVDIAAPVR